MKINENFRIESDTHSWVLIFSDPRVKEKKDGTEEDYIYEDKWYYPSIKGCLNKFTDESCKDAKSIEDLSKRLKEISRTIENFIGLWSPKLIN